MVNKYGSKDAGDLLRLILLPMETPDCSFTVLPCEADRDLFKRIQLLDTQQISPKFRSLMGTLDGCVGHAFGPTLETPWSEPMTYTDVKSLLTVPEAYWLGRNGAIRAYLKASDPEMNIALFWS